MKSALFAFGLIVCVLAQESALFAGVVLLSDRFDTENAGVAKGSYSNFANWDVTLGTVDLIGNGVADFYPGQGLYVDLAGTGRGRISSKTNFVLGPGTYEFKFLLGSNPAGVGFLGNGVTFSIGDWFTESLSVPGRTPLIAITRSFTLSEQKTGRISFLNHNNNSSGAIIDEVSFELMGSPNVVPEPTVCSIILSGASMCFVQRIVRRRSRIRAEVRRSGAGR